MRYESEVFPGRHEELLDCELFDRVQAIRRKRYRGGRGAHSTSRVYLLTRLARCHLCRLCLTGEAHKKSPRETVERYYAREVANRRGFDCPAGGRSVRTDALDDQVGGLVKALVLPTDWQAAVLDLVAEQDTRAEVEREKATTRTRSIDEGGTY